MSNKQQRELYSEFCDHVRENCRTGPNRGLGVDGDFETTHEFLIVKLKNVTEGNGDLFNNVKAFRNTELVIEDAVGEGPHVYEARIPLDSLTARPRSKKSKRHNEPAAAPSLVELMAYLMGLMAVGLGATWTTTANDWTFLF